MPWTFVASTILLVAIIVGMSLIQARFRRKEKDVKSHIESTLHDVARAADRMHERKRGRRSTMLEQEFPELYTKGK